MAHTLRLLKGDMVWTGQFCLATVQKGAAKQCEKDDNTLLLHHTACVAFISLLSQHVIEQIHHVFRKQGGALQDTCQGSCYSSFLLGL